MAEKMVAAGDTFSSLRPRWRADSLLALAATLHHGDASIETTHIYVKWSDEGLRKTVGEW